MQLIITLRTISNFWRIFRLLFLRTFSKEIQSLLALYVDGLQLSILTVDFIHEIKRNVNVTLL